MAKHSGELIGKEICKILGLDETNVSEIGIDLCVGNIAKVKITRYLITEEIEEFKQILEEYELIKKEVNDYGSSSSEE